MARREYKSIPAESALAHRVFRDPAFPYITNNSPVSTETFFDSGSVDILTSIAGIAQRRPGFADYVETTPTFFVNLKRIYTWDRFDGNFYIMFCDLLVSGVANVYKLQVGVDASAVLIYTDPNPTNTPYDFVSSNNTLYFSNGFYVKKWSPDFVSVGNPSGVRDWGLEAYSASSTLTAYTGTGANVSPGSGNAWANPTNIQGAPDLAYSTGFLNWSGSNRINTQYLQASNFGFAVPSVNSIQGIQVDITGHWTQTTGTGKPFLTAQLMTNGVAVGNIQSNTFGSTTDFTLTFGGPSDTWGTTLSSFLVNAANFQVQIQGIGHTAFGSQPTFVNSSGTISIDSCLVTVSDSGSPIVTFTGTGLTATTGYQYVICYGDSITGMVGSPCPPSNLVKPSNQSMSIPVQAIADPDINQIRIFRTTDSATGIGGQAYFEIPNSPVANANASITDSATDIQLNPYSIAPTPTFNDPPPPMRRNVSSVFPVIA